MQLFVTIHVLLLQAADAVERRRHDARRQGGQATAEYALVLLGAAAVALLLVAWASRTNRIGRLFDTVLDKVLDRV